MTINSIIRGEVYLNDTDRVLLKDEPDYVKRRYAAVVRTLDDYPLRITRDEAAEMIGISRRQLQRVIARFRDEGLKGLRPRSRAPHTVPFNKTPPGVEERVVALRRETGFGPDQLALIVGESLAIDGSGSISRTTCYHILLRNGVIEAEKREKAKEYRSFERSRPDELIQSDLTYFNGVTLVTMEDDHSRKGWATSIIDGRDENVAYAMEQLHPYPFENLLTDNGSQFSRKNSTMAKYCEKYLTGRHIWTSIHHPQTMDKLSAFQKGMKRFLKHRLGSSTQDMTVIDECISTYIHYYNNGRIVSTTGCYPEERYSGKSDFMWYDRLITRLKLQDLFPISSADRA